MKRYLLPVLTLFFLNSLLTGCLGHGMVVVHRSPAPERTVVVKEKRLPKRVVKRKRAPRPTGKYEWVKGHWSWDANVGKYVWVPGHWEKQRATHRWVPGHYEWRNRGNYKVKVWVKGHWEVVKTTSAVQDRVLPKAPPRKRQRPQRPTGKYEWVKGHWSWDANVGKYVWVPGHWERQQTAKRWVPGHYEWKVRGRHRVKVWVKGHWEVVKTSSAIEDRVLPKAPPRKRQRPQRPTGKYEWVKGHWSWDANVGKYVWVPGHWERQQAAKRWVPGHYEWKVRGRHRVKVWVKGHWEKVGQTQRPKVRQTQPQIVKRPLPARPPRSANARPNPRRGHIWVKGHWKWTPNAGKYVWSDGRYEKKKRNMQWQKGHYKWKTVGNQQIQIWVRGRWVR